MRNRNLSSFEYFNTAVAIRNDVTRLVTSRDVPKSYRFIFAVPMAETARSVVFNLVKADAFYPNTPRNVDERKRYMTLALADLNQLYQDMQSLLTMGLPIKAARRAFEEGRGDHRACARKYAPRDGCRSLLAWRGSRLPTAFHGQPSSGCWMPTASRAGCPHEL